MRVVSLLPSATEMLYAIGLQPVGVSHECDYPPQAQDLPTVCRSRIDATASSGEIDDQVQEATETGGVYEINRETLASLDPDIVVSQGICDVCAVDDSAVRQAIRELELDASVIASDPHSLADVLSDLDRLGAILGCPGRAGAVRDRFEARIEEITVRTPSSGGPRVAVLDWLDPVMVAGHWIPGMVERLGARYGLAEPGDHSRPREWAEIREYDPDILIVSPCGFGLDQTVENAADLTQLPGWEDLTAVREGRVVVIDGHHYVNRPGPRLVETLAALASLLYPGSVEPPADAVGEFPVNSPQSPLR